jgi:purine-binding chemotaxis protein CheW
MDMRDLHDNPTTWRILEERARALALQETTTDDELGEVVLTFRLGDGGYTIPARFVREVQPLVSWTALPSTPPFVVGLTNVRGRLLAVLDIRPLLDIAQTTLRSDAFLLVVSANGMDVGLLADHMIEVRHGDADFAPALSTITRPGSAWVRGVDRDLNLLLDPPMLLADPRLTVKHGSE